MITPEQYEVIREVCFLFAAIGAALILVAAPALLRSRGVVDEAEDAAVEGDLSRVAREVGVWRDGDAP